MVCVLRDQVLQAQRAVSRLPQLQQELAKACSSEPVLITQELAEKLATARGELHRQWVAAHYSICGAHYPDRANAMNYAAPHPEGEHCYWPEPDASS